MGHKRIAGRASKYGCRLLQPERFAHPPRNLLGVNGTFSLDAGKRRDDRPQSTEIEAGYQ